MNKLKWSAKGTTLTQKEMDAYVKSRLRPGEKQTVIYGRRGEQYEREIVHGLCPNNTCDHTYCLECERADCPDCRGTCT